MTASDDKAALRVRMRGLRRRLAAELPDAAARAAELLPMERLPAFACFSGYCRQGSEFDPDPLVERLSHTGALFALPAALDRSQPLVFREWEAGEPLSPDAFGIPAPGAHAPEMAPDLVLAPVLAFDRQGGRLGQGAGHYDRTLANLRAAKPVFVLGLAFSGQEVDRLPGEAHDQRLDAILTETGYIEVG